MLDIYLQILIKFQVVKLPAYRFANFFFVGEMGISLEKKIKKKRRQPLRNFLFIYFLDGIMKLHIITLHHAQNLDVLDVQNI